jgi:type IV pilus assembly protein PilC
MPLYVYKAINKEGEFLKGKMTAENEVDLEQRLKELRADLVSCRPVREGGFGFGGKVKSSDLIMLCVQLQQLDKAGVPILQSLADLRDSIESTNLKSIVADVYENVRNGALLSEAMAKHPRVFDTVFAGLVSAGENTGSLHESFASLSDHIKWNAEIKRKVKKAVTYPIFTLILMVGVVAFMMVGVVPQITSFLTSQGQELPGHTKALIATSGFFAHYWFIILPIPFVIFTGIKAAKKSSYKFALKWDSVMMRMPIIGKPIKKIDLARFTRFFSILYTSGIDILECLRIGRQVVNNLAVKASIDEVRASVSDGSSLTAALTKTGQFPTLVLRMFKIGEESGNMKDALENVNFFYDQEVNDSVEAIIGTIKPVMTLLLGGLLIWIAVAMFGPLYNTIGQMEF